MTSRTESARLCRLAKSSEELIEFRLDGGVDAGEQEGDDRWQGEGPAAGEVLGVEVNQFEELL